MTSSLLASSSVASHSSIKTSCKWFINSTEDWHVTSNFAILLAIMWSSVDPCWGISLSIIFLKLFTLLVHSPIADANSTMYASFGVMEVIRCNCGGRVLTCTAVSCSNFNVSTCTLSSISRLWVLRFALSVIILSWISFHSTWYSSIISCIFLLSCSGLFWISSKPSLSAFSKIAFWSVNDWSIFSNFSKRSLGDVSISGEIKCCNSVNCASIRVKPMIALPWAATNSLYKANSLCKFWRMLWAFGRISCHFMINWRAWDVIFLILLGSKPLVLTTFEYICSNISKVGLRDSISLIKFSNFPILSEICSLVNLFTGLSNCFSSLSCAVNHFSCSADIRSISDNNFHTESTFCFLSTDFPHTIFHRFSMFCISNVIVSVVKYIFQTSESLNNSSHRLITSAIIPLSFSIDFFNKSCSWINLSITSLFALSKTKGLLSFISVWCNHDFISAILSSSCSIVWVISWILVTLFWPNFCKRSHRLQTSSVFTSKFFFATTSL